MRRAAFRAALCAFSEHVEDSIKTTMVVGTRRWPFRLEGVRGFLLLGLLLLAAAAGRWWNIDAKSLWFDEAYSIYLADRALGKIPAYAASHDTHPPLYYLLLHAWMLALGKGELAVRSLSSTLGVIVVLLTVVLATCLCRGRSVAFAGVAGVLVALSPFAIAASQEARMYPLFTVLAVGAALFLHLATDRGRAIHWMGYVISTILLMYTHYYATFVLLSHAAFIFMIPRARSHSRSWLVSLLVVAVAFAPWLLLANAQLRAIRLWPDIRPPLSLSTFTQTLGLLGFGGHLLGMGSYHNQSSISLVYQLPLLLPVSFLALAGMTIPDGSRERALPSIVLLVSLIVPFLVSLQWHIVYPRYFSFLVPFYAILVARGVLVLAERISRGRAGGMGAAAALLGLIASFYLPALMETYAAPAPYDWRTAAAYVRSRIQDGDVVVFVPAFAEIPFRYYYPGPYWRVGLQPRELVVGGAEVLHNGQKIGELIGRLAKEYRRMWVVATVPLGQDARERLGRLITPHFAGGEGRAFGLVFTFLWEPRVRP